MDHSYVAFKSESDHYCRGDNPFVVMYGCCLQDGKVEPELFTEELQKELKSSPQPYLVPFLKVSSVLLFFSRIVMAKLPYSDIEAVLEWQ